MKRTPTLTAALAALALAALSLAGAADAAMKGSADVVKAAPAASRLSALPGETVEFAVQLEIADHWHLYAHGDSNFIGVDLVPAADFPLDNFDAEYPAGKEGEFFGEKVMMIEGSPIIRASAMVPAGAEPGDVRLDLSVTVQACDDKTCLAPAKLPVSLTLTVE
jgi:hypothetical protein